MNEDNLEYLKKSLLYLGFAEKLNDVLQKAIERELPKFTLGASSSVWQPGSAKDNPLKDYMHFEFNFSQSKQSDMYFLNNYKAVLSRPNMPDREQTFALNNSWTTAREAYNLLSGRSVNTDIKPKEEGEEKVNVWKKLDLEVKDANGNHPQRFFYPQYGYDLPATLAKYPIKELNDPEKKDHLIKALHKGDLVQAELLIKDSTKSVFISANPEMKGLNIYDKQMKVIRDEQISPERAKEKKSEEKGASEAASLDTSTEQKGRGKTKAPENSPDPWEQDQDKTPSQKVGR